MDGDKGTHEEQENIYVVERYSIENYIFDPIHIFFFFIKNEKLMSKKNLAGIVEKIKSDCLGIMKIPDSFDLLWRYEDATKRNKLLQIIVNNFTGLVRDSLQEYVDQLLKNTGKPAGDKNPKKPRKDKNDKAKDPENVIQKLIDSGAIDKSTFKVSIRMHREH